MDERIREVLDHENSDLVWGFRLNNKGRPETYQIFLQKCQEFINGKLETAVNDRRHDHVTASGESVVHLAMAISARYLHDQVASQCEEGTPIPSVQWLRLQFWPNKATAATQRHTGKLKVKMMVSARQFRKHHIDAHYASAVFRYEKEFCVKFREITTFICEDDKHTIKVGDPVAAVERGKKVLVGLNQVLEVGDHDFTKFSLSPSVSFDVDIPERIDESFYHGQLHVGLKENAFEPSSAIRHACERAKCLRKTGKQTPVECHYHDGGSDHNLRFLRTQLSQVAYFLERNLDLLVLVQTPPHHSWKNPAERVMSNLNLALQGCGMVRQKTETLEKKLQNANNLKQIRALREKHPGIEEEVKNAIQPTKELQGSVFQRCQTKGKKFLAFEAASAEEVLQLAGNIGRIDPELSPDI